MDKTEFLTIFPSFENIEVVKQTLPSVINETKRNDARLIVHDSSVNGREEKWAYLQDLNKDNDFFLLLSDNLSMAHARNMCLALGQELYAPDYICMVEDDHGFKEGLIPAMVVAMKNYYGMPSPNGLRFGLFTGCGKHHYAKRGFLPDSHAYPLADSPPGMIGGTNSCFRCAPAMHWNHVLKGYDPDEYLISTYQTRHLVFRNYNRGFTVLIVENGEKVFCIDNEGRGSSDASKQKLWDENYTASDARSRFKGKTA